MTVAPLSSTDLETALADIGLVARTYFFEEIGSTSTWAKELVGRAGAAADLSGTLVIANRQTAGRGRLGRTWESPAGLSLLFTLILAPPPGGGSGPEFDRTVAAAAPVALCEALSEIDALRPRVKYPNDVLLSGQKVAGILIERTGASGSAGFCVLGIGVNVNQTAEDLPVTARVPPTSVALAAGRAVELPGLLSSILRRLEANLADPARAGRRMAALCDTVGRLITVRTSAGALHGTALAYQPSDGSLLLRLDSGMEVSVLSGDIEQLEQSSFPPIGDAEAEVPCESL